MSEKPATPAAKTSKLATHVAVTLSGKKNPSLKRCGDYLPDRVYTVACAEAQRLVSTKGFDFVTPGDRAACEEALAAAAAAKTIKSEG